MSSGPEWTPPVLREGTRPVLRIELGWGGVLVGELEMLDDGDHLIVLALVLHDPPEPPPGPVGVFARHVTEGLLSAAMREADRRSAALSIAVPAANTYSAFLAAHDFSPLAGKVWRRL